MTMTAADAREAAGFFRREVAVGEQTLAAPRHPLIDASEHGQGVADIAKVTAFKRAAAVALDAYADGIDAAAVEREACAARVNAAVAAGRHFAIDGEQLLLVRQVIDLIGVGDGR